MKVIGSKDKILAGLRIFKDNCSREGSGTSSISTLLWSYIEIAENLLPVLKEEETIRKSLALSLGKLIEFCISRAETLKKLESINNPSIKYYDPNIPVALLNLLHMYCVEKAISLEERKHSKMAIEFYVEGISAGMELNKMGRFEKGKIKFLHGLLDRAENLKKRYNIEKEKQNSNRGFTQEEIETLKLTSKMNGIEYLPFIKEIDTKERFFFSGEFCDPDGVPRLNKSQSKRFYAWRRPKSFMSPRKPVVISSISPYSITQTCVTDCSFISSLIVTSAYERKYGKKLVTKLIYPQNKNQQPVYNESGKYMVKLFFNGVWRKVIIDDLFPVDSRGHILCSHTSNKDELWVSLLEKAFIKVNGGYDFPGSNSGVDLHNLTGWIPESVHVDKKDYERDSLWKRLFNGHRLGHCLVTISTGSTSYRSDYEQVGLSDGHAYAVLDFREVMGNRLLLVKNPWNKRRWKGKWSPNDKTSWTHQMRKALNYDLIGACQYDNGVFWIDFDSVLHYYSNIHISWNPKLFNYKSFFHGKWSWSPFSKFDEHNLSRNPQYLLTINASPNEKTSTWIMISKHMIKIARDDDEFLGLYVYDTDDIRKRKNPDNGCRAYKRGTAVNKVVFSNNQHRRYCINTVGKKQFTLVPSQYDKVKKVFFSINCWSNSKISLQTIKVPQYSAKIEGEWKGVSAAGSVNDSNSYKLNPQYLMHFNYPCRVNVTLESMDRKACVNMIVFDNFGRRIEQPTSDLIVKSSGTYVNSFTFLSFDAQQRDYTLVVSTFNKYVESKYQICVEGNPGCVQFQRI